MDAHVGVTRDVRYVYATQARGVDFQLLPAPPPNHFMAHLVVWEGDTARP
jgi:hypothetical protein